MKLFSYIWVSFKISIIILALASSIGFAMFSYNVGERAFTEAQEQRENTISKINDEYVIDATCNQTSCEYQIISERNSSQKYTIKQNSTQTITFNNNTLKVTATESKITITQTNITPHKQLAQTQINEK